MKTTTHKPYGYLILYFISTGFYANRILTRLIFQSAGKWAWIYIWGFSILILLCSMPLYKYIQKLQNTKICMNKLAKIFLYIYLFISSLLCMTFLFNLTNSGWLFETPLFMLIIPFLGIIYYVLQSKFDVLLRLSTLFIFPIAIQYLIFVFAKNKAFDLYAIIPYDHQNIQNIGLVILALIAMLLDMGLCLFYFQDCPTKIKKKHFYPVVWLHVFSLCYDSLIATGQFGVLISDLPFVYYESWRVINFGQFIVYLDTLAFFYWVTSAFCRIALSFRLIKQITTPNSHLYLFSYFLLGICVLFILNHASIYATLRIPLFFLTTLSIAITLIIRLYQLRKQVSK